MQIPIINGIYTDESSDFRTSYPRNLIPVPKSQGISNGYLRPAAGIQEFGTVDLPGIVRGGINWNNELYRVAGTKLVKINDSGSYVTIGDVGGSDQVTFDYGPNYLAIASNNNLFLYDGSLLQQVNDADLGKVLDVVWVDGYFMTTDGEFLIVTELTDSFSVDPLKYGSSEADPDVIQALLKLRNEIYVANRHTIEVFDNTGGSGFPFERIEGAQIEKGVIGTHACCIYMESVAFVGNGFNESPSVYMGRNGNAVPIATREIDQILKNYTEEQLSNVLCESKVDNKHEHLLIHLPDQTLVYDGPASRVVGQPVWFTLTSSILGLGQYRAKNHVWCYDRWTIGDTLSAKQGELVNTVSSHFNKLNGWDFSTVFIYNNSKGAIVHSLELVALTGRVSADDNPVIWTSYSLDGETYSQEKSINAGKRGDRSQRLQWRQQGTMRNFRNQKFRGTSDSHVSFVRLEVELEPLYV